MITAKEMYDVTSVAYKEKVIKEQKEAEKRAKKFLSNAIEYIKSASKNGYFEVNVWYKDGGDYDYETALEILKPLKKQGFNIYTNYKTVARAKHFEDEVESISISWR